MRLLLVAALLTAAAPASAADWRLIVTDEGEEWGRSLAFVDVDALVREGSRIRFPLDIRIERPQGPTDGVRTRIRADCATRRLEDLGGNYYSGSTNLGPSQPEPEAVTEPETNFGVLLANLCAGNYLSGSVDPVAYAREQFGR